MALIPKVGRKSGRVRLFTALVYFLLIVGGATMIYPFLLMVSGSFKSDVDINNYNIIPRYFFDNEVLYRKYLESKYDESLTQYNMNSRQKVFGFGKIRPPDRIHQGRVSDWREFLEQTDVPLSYSTLGHSQSVGNRLLPEMARGYKGWIQEESNGDIETFNERYDAHIRSWLEVFVPKLLWGQRKFRLSGSRAESALLEYKSRQESRHLYYLSLDGKYVQDFLYYKYGKKIKDYNQAHGSQYQSYSEIFLSSRMPEDGKEKEDWMEFVKNELNLQFILVSLEARDEFSEFLRERYEGEIGVLNSTYESNFATFSEVPYPEDVLYAGERVVDWDIFVRQVLPKYLSIKSTELFWR